MSSRTLHLIVGIALTGSATAVPLQDEGETKDALFLDISIDAAMAKAKESDKLLLLAWMKTWEPESKKLDQFTWADPAVRVWVREHTVPVQIDGEADLALPAKFRITSYPTTLIMRNDGVEAARLIGYLDPQEFVLEAEVAMAGRVGATLTEAPDGELANDPMSWIAFANTISGDKSRATEVVEAYLWALDNGEEHQPGFRAAYLEFLLKRIAAYKHKTLLAKRALVERRDAITEAMLSGAASAVQAREIGRFNYWLRQEDQGISLFRQLKSAGDARKEIRAAFFEEVLPTLAAYKLYDAILEEGADVQARLRQQAEEYLLLASSPTANISKVHEQRTKFVSDCADFYEALLATGHGEDAEAVKEILIETVPTGRSFAQLMQKAGRLEQFKLVQALGEEAMERLPEGRTRLVETALRNYSTKAGKIQLKR